MNETQEKRLGITGWETSPYRLCRDIPLLAMGGYIAKFFPPEQRLDAISALYDDGGILIGNNVEGFQLHSDYPEDYFAMIAEEMPLMVLRMNGGDAFTLGISACDDAKDCFARFLITSPS